MKALAYLRCSGVAQGDGDTWDRQEVAINTYAKQHDIEIVGYYRELGVSGTKDLVERPALCDLLADAKCDHIDTIIVEKLDRLARDLMVSETIIADMLKGGHTLISTMEPDLCSADPSRKLIRQIFSAISEYDRAMVVLKLRGARERTKAKTGRCEGQKPFGHYEQEKIVLDQIWFFNREGEKPAGIAYELNARGYKTRSGKPWNPKVVARILKRELNSTKQTAICA